MRICSELRAEILHIQTPPPSFIPDDKLKDIRDLFTSIDLGAIKLAWELRGRMGKGTIELMRDLEIIHCADISREMPAFDSDMLYTRLFGKGEHNLYQFDNAELVKIDERVKESNSGKAYLTFHGARMYSDAARLKVYEKSGTFHKVTKAIGLESLRSVLEEDAEFPATKSELIVKQGWKVFDLTEKEHVHASVLLERLRDRTFGSVKEVLGDLKFL